MTLKFRDTGKYCHSLDGDIIGHDYTWITNSFGTDHPDSNLRPVECSDHVGTLVQERGRSVFYTCLADDSSSRPLIQILYRERRRSERARESSRPYRISRVLTCDVSSSQDLTGPLPLYAARYPSGYTLAPEEALRLPALTQALGDELQACGYELGPRSQAERLSSYQELIEVIVERVCAGENISIFKAHQPDVSQEEPIEEGLFYALCQEVWSRLPTPSLRLLFSASWNCDEVNGELASTLYTLTSPLSGRYSATKLYLTLDGEWGDHLEGWRSAEGCELMTKLQRQPAESHEQLLKSLPVYLKWKANQPYQPLYHRAPSAQPKRSSFLEHLEGVRRGDFEIPYEFESCERDPFDHPLSDFNHYQLTRRLAELLERREFSSIYQVLGWRWCTPTFLQSFKSAYPEEALHLDHLLALQAEAPYFLSQDRDTQLTSHERLYLQFGEAYYKYWRDDVGLLQHSFEADWLPNYDYFIYSDQSYELDDSNSTQAEALFREHEDLLRSLSSQHGGLWSTFKKKYRSFERQRELAERQAYQRSMQRSQPTSTPYIHDSSPSVSRGLDERSSFGETWSNEPHGYNSSERQSVSRGRDEHWSLGRDLRSEPPPARSSSAPGRPAAPGYTHQEDNTTQYLRNLKKAQDNSNSNPSGSLTGRESLEFLRKSRRRIDDEREELNKEQASSEPSKGSESSENTPQVDSFTQRMKSLMKNQENLKENEEEMVRDVLEFLLKNQHILKK